MAKDKKSFLFYVDWGETFDELSNEDAGKLIKHLCDYVRDKSPETDSVLIKAVFANMKSTLKRDLDKWRTKSLKNSENAKKRWHANAYERKKTDANHADRDKVIVNDKVIDIDNVTEKNNKVGNPPAFSFKKSLLNYGFEKQLVKDFLQNRKTRRLSNTKTAYDDFILEVEKTGREKNEIFKIIVKKGWGSFKASWNYDDKPQNNSPHHNLAPNGDYGTL